MHSRKRKSGTWKVVLAIVIILLIALAGGLAAWYFWPNTTDINSAQGGQADEVQQSSSGIKGLMVHTARTDEGDFGANASTAEQQVYLDDVIDFAIDSSVNALFVDVIAEGANGDEPTIFYRDRGYEVYPNMAQNDSVLNVFSRFDALSYICDGVKAAGISVYGVAAESFSGDVTAQASFARMLSKYELAGLYYCAEVEAGAALGTLTSSADGGAQLLYTADGAWSLDSSDLFAESVKDDFAGAVIDDYKKAQAEPEIYGVMLSTLSTRPQTYELVNYTELAELSITYPAEGEMLYTATCYIMGTSDPAEPLYLNGEELERNTKTGLFGTLVTLARGENEFEFKNGDKTINYTIERDPGTTTSSSSSTNTEREHDGTVEVEEGTAVRVDQTIASLLYSVSNDGNINATVREGATARVVNCVETIRNGKDSWAYQLASGDFVLAYNTEQMPENYTDPVFTGAAVEITDTGEKLTFTGDGQPLIYPSTVDNTLVLHIYDASLQPGFAVTGSEMVKSCQMQQLENGAAELVLTFDEPLWGYTVTYSDNKTILYLNNTPHISDNPEKPLESTRVLLDPGHGETSPGAMGVAGNDNPVEQDVNLAVALAARYRLQQLGATVYMTREDGTFLELEERNNMITDVQPDYFISVHHNSTALTNDISGRGGTECYYFDDNSAALAELLVDNVVAQTGRPKRGAFWGYYYVTRNTTSKAVLLECGFMVDPAEYENVVDNDVIWREGFAIAESVWQDLQVGIADVPSEEGTPQTDTDANEAGGTANEAVAAE